jgi:hypothetical protein
MQVGREEQVRGRTVRRISEEATTLTDTACIGPVLFLGPCLVAIQAVAEPFRSLGPFLVNSDEPPGQTDCHESILGLRTAASLLREGSALSHRLSKQAMRRHRAGFRVWL